MIMTSEIQRHSISDIQSISATFAESGMFKDASDKAKAFVKVLAGQELGIPPFASMTGIHVIQGKPELGANLLAALVKQSGRYNFAPVEVTEKSCAIKFYERWNGEWREMGISTFTIEDAKKAGTQNVNKFPRNMLFARALSNGVKWYCPDVSSGMTIYSEGEISGNPVTNDSPEIPAFDITPDQQPMKESPRALFAKAIRAMRTATDNEALTAAYQEAEQNAATSTAKQTLSDEYDTAVDRLADSLPDDKEF